MDERGNWKAAWGSMLWRGTIWRMGDVEMDGMADTTAGYADPLSESDAMLQDRWLIHIYYYRLP